MKSRPVAAAVVLALSCAGAASAQPEGRCTHETLVVRGTPVTATYCVAPFARAAIGHDLPVQVSEMFSTPQTSFGRVSTLRFIAGEDASRVIEDVPLGRLGLEGMLHTTLVFRGGAVHVDSAVLTPGAVTIK